MKRLSFYITFLCVIFGIGISTSFADPILTRSATPPIVGPILADTTGAGNAGTGIFEWDGTTVLPPISGTGEVYVGMNDYFHGNFFFHELGDGTTTGTNPGWTTFNICQEQQDGTVPNPSTCTLSGGTVIPTSSRVHLIDSGDGNIFYMTGFLWSQGAGWITPNWILSGSTIPKYDGTESVIYNKTTGAFHGFAWSENVGYIALEGLYLDITPPSLTSNFAPMAASGSATLTLSNPSPIMPPGGSYDLSIEKYNSTAMIPSSSPTPTFTGLDFRQAKSYALTITDPFGNSTTGNIQVVADVPFDTLNSINIGAVEASTYSGSFADSRIADASAVHFMSMKLRDQYGNPVITEPGIKTVTARVAFNNNTDKNQLLSIGGVIGDAIQFPGNAFPGLTYLSGTVGAYGNTTGDYTLNISSYAPTKAGYAFTNPNDISLQKLSYEVTPAAGISWVGETDGQIDKKDKIGTNNLRFSPTLYVGNVTNSDSWSIIQGYNTNFSATLLNTNTVPLTTPKVAHILDIDSNVLISYQNPLISAGGTEICSGYMKTVSTGMGSYTLSGALADPLCRRPDSSNILMSPLVPVAPSSTMDFSWKPTIILASPANSTVKYASEISYMNGSVEVKYPSYNRSNNSALSATGAVISPASGTTGSGVTNQSVKILGISNSNNMFNTLSGNTVNNVSSLTRVDIKNAIHKNVEIMTKGGASGTGTRYQVYTGNKTLSSWPDTAKDTIIVKGGDLIIDGDILNTTANVRGIIVLEDAAGMGGNIYIKKNVSNIAAVLFTDKSILSGELTPALKDYYSDTVPSLQTATGQLFIEGSIISDNTIGGASMTPLKCPYNVVGCSDVIAKRYDLNYFRFYKGIGATSPGASLNPQVPAGSETYPFVIKYDSRLQTAPPPGFTIQ